MGWYVCWWTQGYHPPCGQCFSTDLIYYIYWCLTFPIPKSCNLSYVAGFSDPLVYLLPKTFKLFGFPIFWLSVPDEGYFNLLTERTWWRLFQSFDWAYLMKVISIFWLSVPDEGYFRSVLCALQVFIVVSFSFVEYPLSCVFSLLPLNHEIYDI
jgi:hypothetical protein